MSSAGMFGSFERMVAFRYLRARREEGFVSVIAIFSLLGIMLGVGTLIVVMAVFNGFGEEYLKQILGFQGDISVLARDAPAPLHDFDPVVTAIRAVPGVVQASPMVEGQAVLQSGNDWAGAIVRGMRLEDLQRIADLADHIRDGALDQLGDDGIVLGYQAALTLGIHVGDTVNLVSPQGTATPFGVIPRRKEFRVAATFDTGFGQFDKGFAFIPLGAAQLFFGLPDGVSAIQVFIADPAKPWLYRGPIMDAAGGRAQIVDWQDQALPYLDMVRTQRSVVSLILTLIIIVAAFNVISSMIMLVRSKGHDIAILRSMGATKGMVLRIFMLTGSSIGFVGTLLGLLAGVAFADNIETIREFLESLTGTNLFNQDIYFLSRLPAKLEPVEVGAVVVVAFALSFLATLYPAWRAARLDPVEALRYE